MKRSRQYFVHYKFLPGLGFWPWLDAHDWWLGSSSTSILRQLIDAGTLSNLPAGFKARGARIRDEDNPINPASSATLTLQELIYALLDALPFKEPSGTLYNSSRHSCDADAALRLWRT